MTLSPFQQLFTSLLLAVTLVSLWIIFVGKIDSIRSLMIIGANERKTADAPVMDIRCSNKAKLSDGWNNDKLDIEDEEKIHLVTNYILYTHRAYNSNLLHAGKRPPTKSKLVDRHNEIDSTLQQNLNHPKVAAIHLLYYHPAISKYYSTLELQNSHKLVLHLTRRDPTVGINLKYIQKCLSNKAVMLIHQDNIQTVGTIILIFQHD